MAPKLNSVRAVEATVTSDPKSMKTKRTRTEAKTWGSKVVEKYRPKLNKLTRSQNDRLLERAMQIAYGDNATSPAARRG
jgi:hypothetical protein